MASGDNEAITIVTGSHTHQTKSLCPYSGKWLPAYMDCFSGQPWWEARLRSQDTNTRPINSVAVVPCMLSQSRGGKIRILHSSLMLCQPGLKGSSCLANITSITITATDLINNIWLFIWDPILRVREDTSDWVSRPHVDLDIDVGQDPCHRLRNTLDVRNCGIGSRIIFTGLSRWWTVTKEESFWIFILLKGILHTNLFCTHQTVGGTMSKNKSWYHGNKPYPLIFSLFFFTFGKLYIILLLLMRGL